MEEKELIESSSMTRYGIIAFGIFQIIIGGILIYEYKNQDFSFVNNIMAGSSIITVIYLIYCIIAVPKKYKKKGRKKYIINNNAFSIATLQAAFIFIVCIGYSIENDIELVIVELIGVVSFIVILFILITISKVRSSYDIKEAFSNDYIDFSELEVNYSEVSGIEEKSKGIGNDEIGLKKIRKDYIVFQVIISINFVSCFFIGIFDFMGLWILIAANILCYYLCYKNNIKFGELIKGKGEFNKIKGEIFFSIIMIQGLVLGLNGFIKGIQYSYLPIIDVIIVIYIFRRIRKYNDYKKDFLNEGK